VGEREGERERGREKLETYEVITILLTGVPEREKNI
jgi:hypothetical protein